MFFWLKNIRRLYRLMLLVVWVINIIVCFWFVSFCNNCIIFLFRLGFKFDVGLLRKNNFGFISNFMLMDICLSWLLFNFLIRIWWCFCILIWLKVFLIILLIFVFWGNFNLVVYCKVFFMVRELWIIFFWGM